MSDNIIPVSPNGLDEPGEKPKTGEYYIDEHGSLYKCVGVAENGNPLLIGGWWENRPHEIEMAKFMPGKNFKRELLRLPEGKWEDTLENLLREPLRDPLKAVSNGESQSTALAPTLGRAQIEQYTSRFQAISDRAELVNRLMRRKMSEFEGIATTMRARLGYLEDVIGLFEQFLGVYQDVVQLRDGQAAAYDAPIHFIQGVRWMDEEVGDVEIRRDDQRGIDFRSVDVFDQWLLEDNHLDLMLPYQKGVVAFKPSRQFRKYSEINFWYDLKCKQENRVIYLLIRNGEKVYRIYTGVSFGDTLFPSVADIQRIQTEIEKAEDTDDELAQLKVKSKELTVRQQVALLQGLIERTEMFNPRPAEISLFREEDYECGRVVLVRDFENDGLPDGRLSYYDWKDSINAKIDRGSRVVLSFVPYHVGNYRLPYPYKHHGKDRAAYRPDPGIYEVVRVWGEKRDQLEILFFPDREVWNPEEGFRPRKTRISFTLHPLDSFVLNYDELTFEDVEFYIGRRFERQTYLDMLPVLYEFYRQRKAEHQQEAEFVKYFASINGATEADVWKAVEWWKLKNIWKRPLTKDEAKAWRMIRRRLKGQES